MRSPDLRGLMAAPSVHFAALGLALYLGSLALGPGAGSLEPTTASARIEISERQVRQMREEMLFELGRVPSPAELEAAIHKSVDEEILVRHALELGLDREPAVERRLALIAGFVEGEAGNVDEAELAERARALGLHRGDRVVRNILVDRATRLVRAAVLSREPSEAALAAYLDEHAEAFRTEPRLAFVHLEAGWGDDGRRAAEQQRARLTRDALPAEARSVDLPERELARRFGHRFVRALADLPVGTWSEPLRSRDGWHLVRITVRDEGSLPNLEAVRHEVRARMRHELAEQWLDERMAQLRSAYTIEIASEALAGSAVADDGESAS